MRLYYLSLNMNKLISFFIFSTFLIPQDYPSLGSDSSFDFMTWNIEWFPKNGQTTLDYVIDFIEQVDVDVIAIQELDDRDMFDQMISSLNGYSGYYESYWFAGLAYIYIKLSQLKLMIYMRYIQLHHIGTHFPGLQWLWI